MWQGGINHPVLRDKWGQARTEWEGVRASRGSRKFRPRLGEARAIEPWRPRGLVAELDSHFGTRMQQRTTRRLHLTDAGQRLIRRVAYGAVASRVPRTLPGGAVRVGPHSRPPARGAACLSSGEFHRDKSDDDVTPWRAHTRSQAGTEDTRSHSRGITRQVVSDLRCRCDRWQ
jgi:hypothetical protein